MHFYVFVVTGVNLVCVTRLTRQVSLVEQELLTLPEHPSSAPVFSGVRVTRSLVLYVCLLIVVCPFVFFYLTIVLSGLPRYTDSDYPFGIFKLFFQFSRGEGRVWILLIEHRHILVNPNVHIFKGQNSKNSAARHHRQYQIWPLFQWVSELVSEWLLFKRDLSNVSAISWREQVNFQWIDDEVHFVLDQHR